MVALRPTPLSLDGHRDASGTARIVVVADTHSQPHAAMGDRIAEVRPAAILHAGDIGDLAVLDTLSAQAPVYAVRGNIDLHAAEVPDHRVIDIEGAPGGTLRLLLVHIALVGPKLRADVARLAHEAGASLVVCGHSHVPFVGRDRGLTVFNPGSIGPRRFALPIVYGVLELGPDAVRLGHYECETGAAWRPPPR